MDPRVAARRRQVHADNVRRRRRRVWWLLSLAGLVAVTFVVARSPLFSVTRVRVVGVEQRQVDEVRAAADVAVGENLLDVDLAEVQADVVTLPWVASAVARREPPATIAVHVRPRVPVATIRSAAGVARVDRHGVVIDTRKDASLPAVIAPDVTVPAPGEELLDAEVVEALRVHVALSDGIRSRVRSYRVAAAGHVVAELDLSGRKERIVNVRFGGPDRIREKEQSLLALLLRLREDDALVDGVTIDVRAPANPVLAAS